MAEKPKPDTLPAPLLCDLCAKINLKALWGEEGYAHVTDARDLQGSSQRCDICRLIIQAMIQAVNVLGINTEPDSMDLILDAFGPFALGLGGTLQRPCPIILALFPGPMFRPPRLHIGTLYKRDAHVPRGPEACRAIDVSLATLYYHGQMGIEEPVPLYPRVGTEELLSRLRNRIFSAGYNPFRRASAEPMLPTRVLDLEPDFQASSLSEDLRLIETSGHRSDYVALSYCWGTYRGCITEQVSLQSRLQLIRFGQLPRLFQDAVYITRQMGVRYLWIDALCIIQDSREDWSNEAVKMAEVYRNCCLRIAATAARDPTEGFFPPKPITCSLRVTHIEQIERKNGENKHEKATKDNETTEDNEDEEDEEDDDNDDDLWEDVSDGDQSEESDLNQPTYRFITLPKSYANDVDRGHLNTRAWVFQERLLAPSTIHFCEDHIYVETLAGVTGEDQISHLFGWLSCIDKRNAGRARLMQEIAPSKNYDDGADTSDSWHRIAEIYAACNITYPTDKLIAIDGLVKYKQTHGKFPYFGAKHFLGMWESTLHEDLLWMSIEPTGFQPLKSLNLPTWSWLSNQGRLQFLKDSRSLREQSTVRTAPVPEFEFLGLTGHTENKQLPLERPVTMSIKTRLSRDFKVGAKLSKIASAESHETALAASPFRHGPGTYNRPIPLVVRNDCFDVRDQDGNLIGFVSFDSNQLPEAKNELCCAHIATLHDETFSGPDPLSRWHYAFSVDEAGAISSSGLGKEYVESSESHILAYCMVITPTGASAEEYQRLGIAEVKSEWIASAPIVPISLA